MVVLVKQLKQWNISWKININNAKFELGNYVKKTTELRDGVKYVKSAYGNVRCCKASQYGNCDVRVFNTDLFCKMHTNINSNTNNRIEFRVYKPSTKIK